MKWHEFVNNPEAIERLYSTPPDLSGVLLQLNYMTQLRRVELRIQLREFPDNPSSRWNKKSNTVSINLILFEIEEIVLSTRFLSDLIMDFVVEKLDRERLVLKEKGGAVSIDFGIISIDRFDSYILDEPSSL